LAVDTDVGLKEQNTGILDHHTSLTAYQDVMIVLQFENEFVGLLEVQIPEQFVDEF
jgi:hypothetical protein